MWRRGAEALLHGLVKQDEGLLERPASHIADAAITT